MIDQFKQAKLNKEVILFKNFQDPDITWDDTLQFIFDESSIQNNNLAEKIDSEHKTNKAYKDTLGYLGNIQIQDRLWLAPQTNNLFQRFEGLSKLLYKVNGEKENRLCKRYENTSCNCDVVWHIQGLRMSLSPRHVHDHNDPWDILYWQVLGTSFWKINNDKVYELNPGDLLYFSQEDSHAVWCEGPRAGFIIDGIGLLDK